MDGFDGSSGVVILAATNRPKRWTRRFCAPAFSTAVCPSNCRTCRAARPFCVSMPRT
ncbi:MAG: hypothetical protein ACLRRT_00920 [Ruthenibacterium lactatiformans]